MERLFSRCRLRSKWGQILLGEALSTFVATLITSGAGVQFTISKSTNAFAATVASGFAICMGIIVSGQLAPLAPLNPNVAFAFTIKGNISWVNLIAYVLGEFTGALLGHFVVYGYYRDMITNYIASKFNGTYPCLPQAVLFTSIPSAHPRQTTIIFDPVVSVFVLSLVIMAIVDERNFNIPDQGKPIYIAVLIISLANAFSLNTGGPLNMAMDLMGRVASSALGWGSCVWTVDKFYFWIPIVMPLIGAAIAAFFYSFLVVPNLVEEDGVDIYDQSETFKHEMGTVESINTNISGN